MTKNNSDTISQLLEKTIRLGATACDVVMFETVDISTSQRMGKPEGLERSESKAIGLRAFKGSQQAIVSGTDTNTDALTELAERAVSMAKATPADLHSTLAPESLFATNIPDLDLCDDHEPDVDWLKQQCKLGEDAALSVEGITNSESADAHYSKSKIHLGIHNGEHIAFENHYASSHFSLSVCVLAGNGTAMQRDYDFTSSRHRSDLQDVTAIGLNAAKRTLERLNPRKVPTCQVPVVFDPRISRGLVSIVANAISGSSIARGSSFLKNALHTQIFPASISIIDNPHIKRGLGSRPFDGEGVRNQKHAIIEDGMLTTWLLDMRTANKLNLTTTGHASRGVSSPPSPASTNLYMKNGKFTPETLIKDIKSGLYVTETFGMGVNIVTGDYSQGAAGFWIENGVIAYPVSEITIAGHMSEMFKSLSAANDLVFRYGTNAPTLRIESMTVAGT
jgi:PmbA protein